MEGDGGTGELDEGRRGGREFHEFAPVFLLGARSVWLEHSAVGEEGDDW